VTGNREERCAGIARASKDAVTPPAASSQAKRSYRNPPHSRVYTLPVVRELARPLDSALGSSHVW
jgi:hypothetical protein